MYSDYPDIIALAAGVAPTWWDSNGVPRFAAPHPDLCPSIYATTVAFLTIACQSCGQEFLVEMHEGAWDRHVTRRAPLIERVGWYGDPPNVGCCPAGATMTSDLVRIEAWWERVSPGDWVSVQPPVQTEEP